MELIKFSTKDLYCFMDLEGGNHSIWARNCRNDFASHLFNLELCL